MISAIIDKGTIIPIKVFTQHIFIQVLQKFLPFYNRQDIGGGKMQINKQISKEEINN